MSRYIDIEPLMTPDNMVEEREDTGIDELPYKIRYGLDITVIRNAPTADVAPVRHGKSISKMHYSDEFICSECGLIMRECCRYEIDEDADGDESCYGFEFKYCPRCGAKMGGERREE